MGITLDNAHLMIDGQVVSAKISRIVEAIHDYEPALEVKWIPEHKRKEGDAAFAIIYNPPGADPYILFYVPKEEDFDERVLRKIIINDQRNGKTSISDLEAWEESQRLLKKQEYLDQLEEAHDIAAHILKSPLNTYKVNDNLVVKDGIPGNAANRTGLNRTGLNRAERRRRR